MDTAAKRFSAISVSLPFRGIQTPPDGASSAADRYAIAYLYAFVSTAPAAGFICVRVSKSYISAPSATGSISAPKTVSTGTC